MKRPSRYLAELYQYPTASLLDQLAWQTIYCRTSTMTTDISSARGPLRQEATPSRIVCFICGRDCVVDSRTSLCRAFNAEHFVVLIEDFDETIRIQNQAVAGCEVNFVR